MLTQKLVVVALSATMLIGCQTVGTKEGVGGVLGAAGGGLLGAQFGKGDGKVAMAALGAVGGLLLGSNVGKSLDDVDRMRQQQAASTALERLPSGSSGDWNNPDSGNSGTFTPTRTFQRGDGAYCREYTQKIRVAGRNEEGHGTACRQADGSWRIAQ
jgi:surface antigen